MRLIARNFSLTTDCNWAGLVSGGLHEKRLLNDLLDSYNVLERPVGNESDPLVLSFGLTLMQIIDVVSVQHYFLQLLHSALDRCFFGSSERSILRVIDYISLLIIEYKVYSFFFVTCGLFICVFHITLIKNT